MSSSTPAETACPAAMVGFVVVSGGRAVAALSVWVVGVDLPPQQLMAGLFGYGLRSLGAAGAPVAAHLEYEDGRIVGQRLASLVAADLFDQRLQVGRNWLDFRVIGPVRFLKPQLQ